MEGKGEETMEAAALEACEFFSGIGGWKQALRSALHGSRPARVRPFDINTLCNDVYKHNYGVAPCPRTIEALQSSDVAAELWLMSPPCQPHTRNNDTATRDTHDPRSQSFLRLVELLRTMPDPPLHIALENVVGFESSDCCSMWREVMRERGYSMLEFHLTPTQFGIPNERPRYYSLSTRGKFANGAEGVTGEVLTSIPGMESPAPARPLSQYIMPLTAEEQQQLLISSDVLAKPSSWCIDIATVDDTSTSCFTKSYSRYYKGTGSVLLIPNEATTTGADKHGGQDLEAELGEATCCDERKEHDDGERGASPSKRARVAAEPQHATKRELLEDPSARQFDPTWYTKYDGRLRYFSPRELLNLFGFDAQFSFPLSCPRKKQYEMIGNSLNAVVASELLRFLLSNDV